MGKYIEWTAPDDFWVTDDELIYDDFEPEPKPPKEVKVAKSTLTFKNPVVTKPAMSELDVVALKMKEYLSVSYVMTTGDPIEGYTTDKKLMAKLKAQEKKALEAQKKAKLSAAAKKGAATKKLNAFKLLVAQAPADLHALAITFNSQNGPQFEMYCLHDVFPDGLVCAKFAVPSYIENYHGGNIFDLYAGADGHAMTPGKVVWIRDVQGPAQKNVHYRWKYDDDDAVS